MAKHGGARQGAGRKPKAEEHKLIEKLTPLETKAHIKLKEALDGGEKWAIELFFKYMYGLPKQIIDQNNTHSILEGSIKDLYGKDTKA